MGIESALSIGGSLIGGMMSGDAAEDAANSQAAAADRAAATQKQMFDTIRGDLSPYRQTGQGANNLLATLLGLPGYETTSGSKKPEVISFLRDVVANEYDNKGYRWKDANRAQTIQGAIDNYRNGLYGDDDATLKLFGYRPETITTDNTDPRFGSLLKEFTGDDLQNDPGYQFGLNEGQKALDRRSAAGGNYFSGAALKALNRYGQDYAGTKFNEGFNRDASTKNRIYSMLSGTTNTGLNAAAQTGSAGTQAAAGIANSQLQGGNAQAAGIVGGANAMAGGIGNAVNSWQWNNLINGGRNKLYNAAGGYIGPDWTTPGYGVGGTYSDF